MFTSHDALVIQCYYYYHEKYRTYTVIYSEPRQESKMDQEPSQTSRMEPESNQISKIVS